MSEPNTKYPRKCITHHRACDCREYAFSLLKDRIKDLEAQLAEANAVAEFYGDADNYGEVYEDDEMDLFRMIDSEDICFDQTDKHFGAAGERARQYLKKWKVGK
jgi:hypothetical protein